MVVFQYVAGAGLYLKLVILAGTLGHDAPQRRKIAGKINISIASTKIKRRIVAANQQLGFDILLVCHSGVTDERLMGELGLSVKSQVAALGPESLIEMFQLAKNKLGDRPRWIYRFTHKAFFQ